MSQEQEDYKEAGERAQSNPSLRYAGRDHCPAACTGTRLVEKQRNVPSTKDPRSIAHLRNSHSTYSPRPLSQAQYLHVPTTSSPSKSTSNTKLTLQILLHHAFQTPPPAPDISISSFQDSLACSHTLAPLRALNLTKPASHTSAVPLSPASPPPSS
jgi:hypothetical protein